MAEINNVLPVDLLMLLNQQLDNFPNLRNFVTAHNLRPSSVFLPQTLKSISENLDYNTDIIFESMDFMDIVNFYSTMLYSDRERLFFNICDLIVEGRTAQQHNLVLNKTALSDFLFTDKGEAKTFLMSNKFLVAIYLVSLLQLLFFKTA